MNERKKAVVFATATIVTALLIVLILFFVFIGTVSPLGKYINVHICCEQTESPIVGLPVYLEGMGFDGMLKTDETGIAGAFGSGLVDGTYDIAFQWCDGWHNTTVTINCSKITWDFFYTVDNPKIIKHFYYDLNDGSQPPVVGLNVSLWDDPPDSKVLVGWQLTDETGTVEWYVDVCTDYYLSYVWGGVQYTEPENPIHFGCPPTSCVWEEWNGLQPKSGGDKN